MAFSERIDIVGRTEYVGYSYDATQILTFGDIFDGLPQFYHGSTFTVEEIATITTLISDASLVDKDKRWFLPLEYRGSWQILPVAGLVEIVEGDTGFITNEVFKIKRYSTYTITANPDAPTGGDDQISLENCNFFLAPQNYTLQGRTGITSGYLPINHPNSLIGSLAYRAAPLVDAPFNRKINGIGLYLYPGVSGLEIRFDVAVINAIQTNYPNVQTPVCDYINLSPCDLEFDQFLAANQDVYASRTEQEVYDKCPTCYRTVAAFRCTTDSTYVKVYYTGVIF